jgi:Ca2+-binding EF-hand superfamily protein
MFSSQSRFETIH